MDSIVYLIFLVALMQIVENYSPDGDTACSYKTPWSGSTGTCWRYCQGGSGPWCYTGDNCKEKLCNRRLSCSGQKCPADEIDCVEECTLVNPLPEPASTELQNFGSVIACEGDDMILHCEDPGKRINITKAIYGRSESGDIICPHDQIYTKNCSADSTEIISGICSGRRVCQTWAGNNIGVGDPCPGTFKYLNVQFNCVSTESLYLPEAPEFKYPIKIPEIYPEYYASNIPPTS